MIEFIKKIFDYVMPPKEWRIPVASLFIVIGVVLVQIFFTSRAYSYLSNDPTACINCHVMTPQYVSWSHSSHGRVTVCNDCHVPHSSTAAKYLFKVRDGMMHSFAFTFNLGPEVIRASETAQKVIQSNCVRCHEPVVKGVFASQITAHTEGKLCFECHRDVPHGIRRGFSKRVFNPMPAESNTVPTWQGEGK